MFAAIKRLFGIGPNLGELDAYQRGVKDGHAGAKAVSDPSDADYVNPLDEVYPQLDEYLANLMEQAQNLQGRGYTLIEDDEDDTANFDLEEDEGDF